MPSAGELLRSERMKRNRNLTDIAAETRISRRYLEAIEADNLSDLPGDFFYRAFIRQYAKVLNLEDRTLQQVLRAAATIHEPDPVPALNLVYENAHRGDSTRWQPSTGVAIGVLLTVLAGGSGLYALWQRAQARAEEPASAPIASTPAPSETPSQEPVAPAAAAPAETPSQPTDEPTGTPTETPAGSAPTPTAVPAQPTAAPPAAPVGEGQVSVELTATESVWVQVWSEGKTVFSGTLQKDQTRAIPVGPTGRLVTGNAAAVEVRVNGKPVGPLGPKGQVRSVLFNGESYEIVAPKPKVPAETEQLFGQPAKTGP